MPDEAHAIGDIIRRRREHFDMSARELAERSGVSRRHVARVESGESRPTDLLLCQLARPLGWRLVFAPRTEPLRPGYVLVCDGDGDDLPAAEAV